MPQSAMGREPLTAEWGSCGRRTRSHYALAEPVLSSVERTPFSANRKGMAMWRHVDGARRLRP
eukprot:260850-Prymnesium_polylepis.1